MNRALLEILDRLSESVTGIAHQGPDVGKRSCDRKDAWVEVGTVPGRSHGGFGQVGVPRVGCDANELDLAGDVGRERGRNINSPGIA